MKGDFSRFTFNPKNRYSRVLMQQGRVQLDADWNEQLDISAYRTETEITDFIGQSGAPEYPKDSGEQSTSFRITANQSAISVGKGRYYVEGMLFENDQPVSLTQQPDYPTATLPKEPGIYLAYLDVWQHHITALEAPALREVALGGADTTTRVKNVWQVKLHRLGAKGSVSESVSDYTPPKWKPAWEPAISTGQLTVQVKQPGAIVENQLYRIEIHQGNATEADQNETVTFKWSRDNGAIAAQVELIDGNIINIKNAGRDAQLAFPVGQLIEFSNDSLTLNGQPGILATVQATQSNRLTVKWKTADEKAPENLKDLIVRRWDSSDAVPIGTPNFEHELEQSITAQFSDKRYKTGDYWLIPARALAGSIEWSPETQTAHGTRHRYCSLALLERTATQFSVLADCRFIFKPITSGLVSKAGDTMTGSLTIDKNLYVTGNVGIGTTSPQAKLEVNGSGGQAIDLIVNGRLKSNNNDGGLWVKDDRFVGGYSNKIGFYANKAWRLTVQSDGNVGIGTTNPATFTNARLVVNSEIPNSGEVNNVNQTGRLESVLALQRSGVSGESWDNLVDFQIGRYSQDGEHASRTQLDILLGHGGLDYSYQEGAPKPTSEQVRRVMTLRSNGNVSIDGADAALAIAGKVGNWKIEKQSTSESVLVEIEEGSYNNLIPIYSESTSGIGNVIISLKGSSKNNWIAICQAINITTKAPVVISPASNYDQGFAFYIRSNQVQTNYVLVTVCLASKV